jgi:hypothetical protein
MGSITLLYKAICGALKSRRNIIVATIRKDGPASRPYCVYSKNLKRKFGCYPTRKEALKRLRQIEHFSKDK